VVELGGLVEREEALEEEGQQVLPEPAGSPALPGWEERRGAEARPGRGGILEWAARPVERPQAVL